MAFNLKSAAKTNNLNEKVKTARVNNVTYYWGQRLVNTAVENGENVVKHMTGNKSFLTNYQEVDGGFVAFAESPKGGKITWRKVGDKVMLKVSPWKGVVRFGKQGKLNPRRGPEFTWEREDQFRKKYPHLFTNTVPSSSIAS
ncbi:hypothetical protein Tco_0641516 [Tanacetum coccineum]